MKRNLNENQERISKKITEEADIEIRARNKVLGTLEKERKVWINNVEGHKKKIADVSLHLVNSEKSMGEKRETVDRLQKEMAVLNGEIMREINSKRDYLQQLFNHKKEMEKANKCIEDLDKKVEDLVETASLGSLELQQVEKRIATKTAELECPVCLNTCSPPIYTCPNQLTTCPVCRVVLGGELRVHRYAERDARELDQLRSDRFRMRVRLHGLMQIFVSNPWRKTLVLEVLPTDTMGRVKEMVEEKSGVHRGQHRLVSGWRRFEDDKTVEFYNIQKESTIEMRLRMGVRLQGLMQIFVFNPMERKTLLLEVLPSDTMGRVREMVEEKSGVPRACFMLVWGCWRRFEDDKTVEFYNIKKENTIEMRF